MAGVREGKEDKVAVCVATRVNKRRGRKAAGE